MDLTLFLYILNILATIVLFVVIAWGVVHFAEKAPADILLKNDKSTVKYLTKKEEKRTIRSNSIKQRLEAI